ncbi:hypothetical protein tb265_07330 [Gemmatimonadetes bacterium T265]|nr:hypothetical protein tb265_07330 [Gemmatimonadetes bacterium T265]
MTTPFPAPSVARTTAGLAVAGTIALAARRSGSLVPSGAAAAVAVGTVAMSAGWGWGALLIGFFGSSTALSRWRRDEKARRTGGVVAKGGARDAAQVLANGGAFAAAAAAGALAGRGPRGAALAGAAAGALGAAAADTWATEVGTALGGAPRLVRGWDPRGWRPAPPGTSGAVTAEGTFGMLAGAAAVALAAGALGLGCAAAVGAFAGGVAGAAADTLLGAAAQERRWCDACGEATEQAVHARCGTPTRTTGGARGLDNDWVNVLCTLVGAAAGAAAGARVGR